MYFIGLGTVTVTTRNGKEVCHLVDGDHFGEFSLIMPDRIRKANVTAIDYCEVYRLNRTDFKKTVETCNELYGKIESLALRRLDVLLIEEERHRSVMYQNLENDSSV